MSKFDFEVALAFATQTAEGTYNSTLDGITSSITHSQGLVLGSAAAGVGESGLSFGLAREGEERAVIGSTLSKPLDDFLRATVPTFQFVMPFCGNRADADATPVDANATPIAGLDALLEGMGLVGAAWGSGVGWRYVYGSPNPISALVYFNGNRMELLDCRVSGKINFPAGGKAILTAEVAVGSIKDHAAGNVPGTTTYGEQETVSSPVVEGVGHGWRDTRGFQDLTLNLTPNVVDVADSNATDGITKDFDGRETTIEATLFADDSTDKIYDYSQLVETDAANLDQLSFQVGADMVDDTTPAKAVQIVVPKPQLSASEIARLGQKAGSDVNLIARGSGSGNNELEIIFR